MRGGSGEKKGEAWRRGEARRTAEGFSDRRFYLLAPLLPIEPIQVTLN